MVTVLIVEDEPKIAEIAKDYLGRAGWHVLVAGTGRQALELFDAHAPSLVVLDLRLPDLDGLEVARQIRERAEVPIIMLTARVQETDRLAGFEAGADDYIPKPFSPKELVARVAAVLRRASARHTTGDVIRAGRLTIDPDTRQVTRDGEAAVELTSSEFELLAALARHRGRIFTRAQLLDVVGGDRTEAFDRAIDTHIKNLRRKIEPDPRNPRYLRTVYGVGYKFVEE
jgi:two-component system, OmpR family, alkaline phosphatase synthesis response regulator PhoP